MVTITFKRPYCKTGTIEEDKKTTKGDKRPLSTPQVPLKYPSSQITHSKNGRFLQQQYRLTKVVKEWQAKRNTPS